MGTEPKGEEQEQVSTTGAEVLDEPLSCVLGHKGSKQGTGLKTPSKVGLRVSYLALSYIEVLKLPLPSLLRREVIQKPAMRLSLQVGSPGMRCDSEQDCDEKS